MRITKLFIHFVRSEQSSGLLLIACTLVSLFFSNLVLPVEYVGFWNQVIFGIPLLHIINDGLMAIFFLMVGLELEREFYIGELSNMNDAILPIIGAIGGMIVPIAIYMAFNYGRPNISGFGIPMATDIAFSLAILALLGSRIPVEIKVFLTALAIMDDLGAILFIAIFFPQNLQLIYLGCFSIVLLILFICNRFKIHSYWPYAIGGLLMWYFMLKSGIHATISGVILAFVIPFGDGSESTISYRLQKQLHYPVLFGILPIFALANTAFHIPKVSIEIVSMGCFLGIFFGLLIGKPLGIFSATLMYSKIFLRKKKLPINPSSLFGIGIIAGIGFTMSIFISILSFEDQTMINISKLAILFSSFLAAVIGYLYFRKIFPK